MLNATKRLKRFEVYCSGYGDEMLGVACEEVPNDNGLPRDVDHLTHIATTIEQQDPGGYLQVAAAFLRVLVQTMLVASHAEEVVITGRCRRVKAYYLLQADMFKQAEAQVGSQEHGDVVLQRIQVGDQGSEDEQQ
ncbi:hypothetical protein LTR10_006571 [Elasticomyces elasticus]|nr:hypothetical protein LTR10_006571 [Elasticomyces elasticus]KAK4973026.1 hypothetical protein LTR42_006320 [Elasticomyces elasticus]